MVPEPFESIRCFWVVRLKTPLVRARIMVPMTTPFALTSPSSLKGPRGLWQAMVDKLVVPEPETSPSGPDAGTASFRVRPAEIRAMAFMASLGPTAPPAGRRTGSEIVDLAGEEALLGYLAKVAEPPAA